MCVSLGEQILRLDPSAVRNEDPQTGARWSIARRATYELGCRVEGREMSRETIMKRRAPVLDGDALAAEIAALARAGIKDLRQRWKILYGQEPSAISAGPL
jgi:hypothetical protein